jgi:splicing factor 3B subunit 3
VHDAVVSSCLLLFRILLTKLVIQETSLELVVVGEDGVLQSICEQSTFGIIKDVGVLDWRFKHFGVWPEVLFFFVTNHNALQFFSCDCHCFIFAFELFTC